MRVDKVCAQIAHAPPPQQGGLVATILAILDRFWLTVDTLKSEQFNPKKLNTKSLKWLNQNQFLAISPEKLSKEQPVAVGEFMDSTDLHFISHPNSIDLTLLHLRLETCYSMS